MGSEVFLYTVGSLVIVSLVSFVSILFLSFRKEFLQKLLLFFVSFAVGALIGDAFLHILPEAIENTDPATFSFYAVIGVVVFFLIEKFLRWHHRHLFEHKEERNHHHAYVEPYVWMNLFGDGIHNFIDGVIVAGSYLISIPLGITTTLAVIFHEGAQELGDFAVLIKGGLSRGRALFYNFLSAVTAVIGGVVTLGFGSRVQELPHYLLPFTFAGFLYISMASLIPELHHEDNLKQLVVQLWGILCGVAIMWVLLFLE